MSAFSALSGPVPCVFPSFPFYTFPSTKKGSPPPWWQEEGSGTSERILPGWLFAVFHQTYRRGEKRGPAFAITQKNVCLLCAWECYSPGPLDTNRRRPNSHSRCRRPNGFHGGNQNTLLYLVTTMEKVIIIFAIRWTSLSLVTTQGGCILVTPCRYYMDMSTWQRTYRILCSLEKEQGLTIWIVVLLLWLIFFFREIRYIFLSTLSTFYTIIF